MTKYIAYIDLVENRLVYMDANLHGLVHSAGSNAKTLAEQMPAFVEYLQTLPTVYDLFSPLPRSEEGMAVCYSDEEISLLEEDTPLRAFVFKPLRQENRFTPFDINPLLAD